MKKQSKGIEPEKIRGKYNRPEEVVHVYVHEVLRIEAEGEDEKENE
jgi:hypothetical protein